MTTKRWFAALFVALVVLVNAGAGACSNEASGGSVTVLGPWTGAEEEQFRQVLDAFETRYDIEVHYQGTRALSQVLLADAERGRPPDVAALPSPGELTRYVNRGDLVPLDDVVGERWRAEYPRQWQQLVRAGKDNMYAVPIQANLKGIVWFPKDRLRETPRTFDELTDLSKSLAGDGVSPWCLGVASEATSGWPGTDWLEDILLKQSGADVYELWVGGALPWTSAKVRKAWQTWGGLVADNPRSVRGGRKAGLLTDFTDAGRGMFTRPPSCLLEHQASFMAGVYSGYEQEPVPGRDFDFFPFPEFGDADSTRSWAVAADLAGMFNDTPQARKLIRFLTSPQAQRIRVRAGTFSANAKVDKAVYPDELTRRLAAPLTGSDTLCFDGSDLMPTTMRNAFYRAVLEYLSNPDRLDHLLQELDRVADGIPRDHWSSVSCGRRR